MPIYIVRKNCEYSVAVEADSPEEAMTKADAVNLWNWSASWSPMEAEPD
jgi:hypothetical protein